ncbi:hypothetical protein [Niastella caeni]|uniref:hypothetical protein n=1 Tax=Niastella caeni TaxID=2569763 RepID=UPI00129A9758|nr:hypothetical protein [Niastella caeni]
MKQTENKSTEFVKVSKAGLIALIASQIKGKILFPKKMEEAKKMLDHARFVKK